MGCTSSKTIDVAGVYRPPSSSFAVFDINAIEEPRLKSCEPHDDRKQRSQLPTLTPILEKLNAIEDAPRTWEEVSKAQEDLKPKPNSVVPLLQAGLIIDSRNGINHPDVPKSLKDNIFIKRDKLDREKEGKTGGFVKRNPLSDFEERCPPDGYESVVLYTTSLGGVRRTYEDCNIIRTLMETRRIVFDERDISLHVGFLNELKELLGEGVGVPRVFVNGRYLGGVEEVVHLNETGRLPRILNWARVERGVGRLGCESCGGARFVP